MKKQTVSLLVLLLASSGFLFSCGNIVNNNAGALEFDSIQVNQTTHLFGDTAKPGSNLIINFAYVDKSSDERMKDSLNAYFRSICLGDKYISMSTEEAIKKYTERYADDYRKDLEPLYKKDEQNKENNATMKAWYSYYKGIEGHIQLYTKQLLVYRIDFNEYTGGAHGIYMSTFFNINLHTLAPIRLDDLFVDDYKDQLTDLLWNQLMADNQVTSRKELEDMGYASTGELEPTENFYLDKEGITFYYNVYDITPYVMGTTKITIPYEMMHHLLSDDTMVLNEIRNN